MSDLVAWLLARLDEDEQAARAAAELNPAPWSGEQGIVVGGETQRHRHLEGALWDDEGADTLRMQPPTSNHIARHDPARVLADVAAKRRIVRLHGPAHKQPGLCMTCGGGRYRDPDPCLTLRLLALPYATAPGYRPEWAP